MTKLTTVWSDSHYKEGIASGSYCNVDIFQEVSNFIVDIFEDCGYFKDSNEEDCNRIDGLGGEATKVFQV